MSEIRPSSVQTTSLIDFASSANVSQEQDPPHIERYKLPMGMKDLHSYTKNFLDVLCITLLTFVYGLSLLAASGRVNDKKPFIKSTFKESSIPTLIIVLSFYFSLCILRVYVKFKYPSHKAELIQKKKTQKYILKTISEFRVIILIVIMLVINNHHLFYWFLLILPLEMCVDGWNKTKKIRLSILLAFLGYWYPECVYQLSNYTALYDVDHMVPKFRVVSIASSYIIFGMMAVIAESAFSFCTGLVLLFMWVLMGNSEVFESAYSVQQDLSQSFNVIILWHVTMIYVLSCLSEGTFGFIKMVIKIFANLITAQKFCCPVSRSIRYGRQIITDLNVGVECPIPEFDLPVLVGNEFKWVCRMKENKIGWFSEEGGIYVKRSTMDDRFDVKVKNKFETTELLCLDKRELDILCYSSKEGIPLVSMINDCKTFYFGHCNKMSSFKSGILSKFKLRQMDKSIFTASWEISVNKRNHPYYDTKLKLDESLYRCSLFIQLYLGGQLAVVDFLYLKVNEKCIRKLMRNKDSKIVYNAFKVFRGIKTSFKFSKKCLNLLEEVKNCEVVKSRFPLAENVNYVFKKYENGDLIESFEVLSGNNGIELIEDAQDPDCENSEKEEEKERKEDKEKFGEKNDSVECLLETDFKMVKNLFVEDYKKIYVDEKYLSDIKLEFIPENLRHIINDAVRTYKEPCGPDTLSPARIEKSLSMGNLYYALVSAYRLKSEIKLLEEGLSKLDFMVEKTIEGCERFLKSNKKSDQNYVKNKVKSSNVVFLYHYNKNKEMINSLLSGGSMMEKIQNSFIDVVKSRLPRFKAILDGDFKTNKPEVRSRTNKRLEILNSIKEDDLFKGITVLKKTGGRRRESRVVRLCINEADSLRQNKNRKIKNKKFQTKTLHRMHSFYICFVKRSHNLYSNKGSVRLRNAAAGKEPKLKDLDLENLYSRPRSLFKGVISYKSFASSNTDEKEPETILRRKYNTKERIIERLKRMSSELQKI